MFYCCFVGVYGFFSWRCEIGKFYRILGQERTGKTKSRAPKTGAKDKRELEQGGGQTRRSRFDKGEIKKNADSVKKALAQHKIVCAKQKS